MFLVDTPVWIKVFRKPSRFRLESVAELEEVATCLPVITAATLLESLPPAVMYSALTRGVKILLTREAG